MFAHFRPIFLCFLSLALGIWFAELFREGHKIYLILLVCALVFVFALSLFKFVFKNNKFFDELFKCNKSVLTIFLSVMIGVVSFVGVFHNVSSENNIKVNSSEIFSAVGVVRKTPVKYEDQVSLFVDDVILQSSSNTYEITKGIYVIVKTEDVENADDLFNAKPGDHVLFSCKVQNADVFSKSDLFSFAYKNNIRYIAHVQNGTINVLDGNMKALDKVRQYIKDTIYSSMSTRYAGLSYAVFVGDVSGLDLDVKQNFRITGIAHLLAVSGLHVSLMAFCIMWLFKKMRMRPKISLLIVAIILLFYCVLCGFSASVLRASLMAIFLLFAQSFGKQNDALNAISLSGIILLLFSPMFVFDLSFLLSYASVFGIIFLYPIFNKMFMKIKLGKFVSGTLAISLSAQLATFPFLINSFGFVSTLSLLTNFLVGPIFEFVYMAFFACLMISLMLPFMHVILWGVQWCFWPIDFISSKLASLSFSSVNVNALSSVLLASYFVLMFFVSRFNVLAKKAKLVSVFSATFVFAVVVCLNYTVPLL